MWITGTYPYQEAPSAPETGGGFSTKDYTDLTLDNLFAPVRGLEGAIKSVYGLADTVVGDALPNYDKRLLGESSTISGGLIEGLTQFVVPYVGLTRLGKIGQLGKVGRFLGSGSIAGDVAAGALVDFTVFEGSSGRLSDLVKGTAFENDVSRYLETDEDDSEFEGRLKNLAEGGIIGVPLDLLFHASKVTKTYNKLRRSGVTQAEAAKAATTYYEEAIDGLLTKQMHRKAHDLRVAEGRAPRFEQVYGNTKLSDIVSKTGALTQLEGADREMFETFITKVGPKLFDDISVRFEPTTPGASNFDYRYKTISLLSESFQLGRIRNDLMHEVWHSLEGRLTPAESKKITTQFVEARKAHFENSPGAVRRFEQLKAAMTPAQTEDAIDEIVEAGEYEFISPAEWFATNATDLTESRLAKLKAMQGGGIKNTLLRIREVFSDFVSMMRSRFGGKNLDTIVGDFLGGRKSQAASSISRLKGRGDLAYARSFKVTQEEFDAISQAAEQANGQGLRGADFAASIPYPRTLNGQQRVTGFPLEYPKYGSGDNAVDVKVPNDPPGANVIYAMVVAINNRGAKAEAVENYLRRLGVTVTEDAEKLLTARLDAERKAVKELLVGEAKGPSQPSRESLSLGEVIVDEDGSRTFIRNASEDDGGGSATLSSRRRKEMLSDMAEADKSIVGLGLDKQEEMNQRALSRLQLGETSGWSFVEDFLENEPREVQDKVYAYLDALVAEAGEAGDFPTRKPRPGEVVAKAKRTEAGAGMSKGGRGSSLAGADIQLTEQDVKAVLAKLEYSKPELVLQVKRSREASAKVTLESIAERRKALMEEGMEIQAKVEAGELNDTDMDAFAGRARRQFDELQRAEERLLAAQAEEGAEVSAKAKTPKAEATEAPVSTQEAGGNSETKGPDEPPSTPPEATEAPVSTQEAGGNSETKGPDGPPSTPPAAAAVEEPAPVKEPEPELPPMEDKVEDFLPPEPPKVEAPEAPSEPRKPKRLVELGSEKGTLTSEDLLDLRRAVNERSEQEWQELNINPRDLNEDELVSLFLHHRGINLNRMNLNAAEEVGVFRLLEEFGFGKRLRDQGITALDKVGFPQLESMIGEHAAMTGQNLYDTAVELIRGADSLAELKVTLGVARIRLVQANAELTPKLHDLFKMADEVGAENLPDEVVLDVLLEVDEVANLAQAVSGAASEGGRYLQALNLPVDSKGVSLSLDKGLEKVREKIRSGTVDVATKKAMLEGVGGKEQAVKFIVKLSETLDANTGPLAGKSYMKMANLVKIANDAKKVGFWDIHNTYFINNLVSSSQTIIGVQMISNILTTALAPLERAAGGRFGDALKLYKHYITSFAESVNIAKSALKENRPIGLGRRYDGLQTPTISRKTIPALQKLANKVGEKPVDFATSALGFPLRGIQAGDEFFKQLNYRAQLKTAVEASLARQGISGTAASAEMQKAMDIAIVNGEFATNERLIQEGWQEAAKTTDPKDVKAMMRKALAYRKTKWDELEGVVPTFTNHADRATFLAKEVTLQADSRGGMFGDAAEVIKSGVKRFPPARLFLPFVSTPINALFYAGDRLVAPAQAISYLIGEVTNSHGAMVKVGEKLGFPAKTMDWLKNNHSRMYKDLSSGDPAIVADAKGRAATGAAMIGLGYTLAMGGIVTGHGPKNREERITWIAAGNQPYSVRVGDTWFSYSRLDPLSTMLGSVADLFMAAQYTRDDEEALDQLTYAMNALWFSTTNNLTNKSYLQGFKSFLEMITGQDPSRFQKWTKQQVAGGWMPFGSAVGTLANTIDPTRRSVDADFMDGILDSVVNRIPGLSTNEPVRDAFGKPILRADQLGPDVLSPIATTAVKNDIISKEFEALGRSFNAPSKMQQGLDLTKIDIGPNRTAYGRFQELAGEVRIGGRNLEEAMQELLTSARYQQASAYSTDMVESPRVYMVRALFSKYRQRAFRQLKKESPVLNAALMQLDSQARASKYGVAPSIVDLTAR
jgi:hypothetical protein